MPNIVQWYFAGVADAGVNVYKNISQVMNHLRRSYMGDLVGLRIKQYQMDTGCSRELAEERYELSLRRKGYGLFTGFDDEVWEWRQRNFTGPTSREVGKKEWAEWAKIKFNCFLPPTFDEVFTARPENKDAYHLFITIPNQQKKYTDFKQKYGITDKHVFSASEGYSINRNMNPTDPRLKWEILKFDDAIIAVWKKNSAREALRAAIDKHLTEIGANDA